MGVAANEARALRAHSHMALVSQNATNPLLTSPQLTLTSMVTQPVNGWQTLRSICPPPHPASRWRWDVCSPNWLPNLSTVNVDKYGCLTCQWVSRWTLRWTILCTVHVCVNVSKEINVYAKHKNKKMSMVDVGKYGLPPSQLQWPPNLSTVDVDKYGCPTCQLLM